MPADASAGLNRIFSGNSSTKNYSSCHSFRPTDIFCLPPIAAHAPSKSQAKQSKPRFLALRTSQPHKKTHEKTKPSECIFVFSFFLVPRNGPRASSLRYWLDACVVIATRRRHRSRASFVDRGST